MATKPNSHTSATADTKHSDTCAAEPLIVRACLENGDTYARLTAAAVAKGVSLERLTGAIIETFVNSNIFEEGLDDTLYNMAFYDNRPN